jgi:glycosyltransferase involved in cell wall biosynthesis
MRALLISENAPVPADRRVWNISRTLAAAGWEVVIVCAQAPTARQPALELLDGIEIHRYPLLPARGGTLGYVREYAQAVWRIRRLVRQLGRSRRFDVVHACNPPDFLLLAALSLRSRGTHFIFDHHDLVPELYHARFGREKGAAYRAALRLERLAFRLADVSIATNDSYRRIAIERGGMRPEDVFVVRNGPDLERFKPVEPDPTLRGGRSHLIAYLGIMGPQDGIDHALRALAALRRVRDDWRALFVGEGEQEAELRSLAAQLGLADLVEFTGWRYDDDIRRILSTADLCLAPDPPSPLNDVSTMIKIPEYMAMGRPVASYDLAESRVSAGEAAVYVAAGDPQNLAACVQALLDDPARRERMGRIGRERVEDALSWQHSEPALLAAYERAAGRPIGSYGAAAESAAPGPERVESAA